MLDRDLRIGRTEMVIMAMVEDRPQHGYEIGKLIEQPSHGVFAVSCRLAYGPTLLFGAIQKDWFTFMGVSLLLILMALIALLPSGKARNKSRSTPCYAERLREQLRRCEIFRFELSGRIETAHKAHERKQRNINKHRTVFMSKSVSQFSSSARRQMNPQPPPSSLTASSSSLLPFFKGR